VPVFSRRESCGHRCGQSISRHLGLFWCQLHRGVRLQLALRGPPLPRLPVDAGRCASVPRGVLGATTLAALSNDCGAACPCDEAPFEETSEHADGEHDDAADPGHDDCAPSDECPDDCPNCHCSMGAALAVMPVSCSSALLTSTSAQVLTPIATPATGTGTAVFRPPRSVV
jgi:hypothetical protein